MCSMPTTSAGPGGCTCREWGAGGDRVEESRATAASLRGTIRDHGTGQRRLFLRFFDCELSHESPDAPLPDAVASGAEPFLIAGAIAGR